MVGTQDRGEAGEDEAARLAAALAPLPAVARLRDVLRDGEPAWVVGGAARDALLGRTPEEVDVLVLDDPAGLAARLGGEVRAHERFGTATVRDGELRWDLARARTESYAAPGALPTVSPTDDPASDLLRRDVRVNAIALGLHDGRLLTVPGALDDLRAGRLRVLHDRSLVDDPTRAWRIARYAARLGFAVDAETTALAGRADPGTVSAERHGTELALTLGEADPGAALAALQELAPAFLPVGFAPRPDGLDEALALLPPTGRADLVRLAACGAAVEPRALLAWLAAVGLTPAERDLVGAASRESVLAPLRRATTPSAVRRAAHGAPVEAVALAGGPGARRWLEELRHVRLRITGDDLLAAGVPRGPEIGRRLTAALEAKLDGRLPAAADEHAAELAAALDRDG